MSNPYVIILIMFMLAGIGLTIWGWKAYPRSKDAKDWPSTEGEIISSELPENEFEQGVPKISFRYRVDGKQYEQMQNFNVRLLTPEQCKEYVEKYPVGANVNVYYASSNPNQASLSVELVKADWMVLGVGIATTLLGVGMILAGIQNTDENELLVVNRALVVFRYSFSGVSAA